VPIPGYLEGVVVGPSKLTRVGHGRIQRADSVTAVQEMVATCCDRMNAEIRKGIPRGREGVHLAVVSRTFQVGIW